MQCLMSVELERPGSEKVGEVDEGKGKECSSAMKGLEDLRCMGLWSGVAFVTETSTVWLVTSGGSELPGSFWKRGSKVSSRLSHAGGQEERGGKRSVGYC